MILSGPASDVRALERGKYTVVITIPTGKEASFQDKLVSALKQLNKAAVLCAGEDELIVD